MRERYLLFHRRQRCFLRTKQFTELGEYSDCRFTTQFSLIRYLLVGVVWDFIFWRSCSCGFGFVVGWSVVCGFNYYKLLAGMQHGAHTYKANFLIN